MCTEDGIPKKKHSIVAFVGVRATVADLHADATTLRYVMAAQLRRRGPNEAILLMNSVVENDSDSDTPARHGAPESTRYVMSDAELEHLLASFAQAAIASEQDGGNTAGSTRSVQAGGFSKAALRILESQQSLGRTPISSGALVQALITTTTVREPPVPFMIAYRRQL